MVKKILLPITSDALLAKGINKIGKLIFSNLISPNSSRLFIWSKKLVPAIIGQQGFFEELLFVIKVKLLSFFFFQNFIILI